MPTERKKEIVGELRQKLSECTVAFVADYRGLNVAQMHELRQRLREKKVEFRVVKNTLLSLAAQEAGRGSLVDMLEGPTGIAVGHGDPVLCAQAIEDYVRTSRSIMTIRGAVLGNRPLSAREVRTLASLPPREQLVASLLGQLQGPVVTLVYTLRGLTQGLASVLQQRTTQLEKS